MPSVEDSGAQWKNEAASTVSDKIRTLHARGHSRAEIARILGKRYQHVRNVLEGDKTRAGPAAPPRHAPPIKAGDFFRVVVEGDGWVQLPEPVRAAFGLRASGGVLVGRWEGADLRLTDAITSARRARDLVRSIIPGDDSLADSLIADRRREAAREADD